MATLTTTNAAREALQGASREAFSASWRRQEPAWHAMFAMIWLASVIVVFLEPAAAVGRPVTLALYGIVLVAYVTFGRRGLRHQVAAGLAYQAIVWLVLCVLLWVDTDSESWILLFALFPQLWAMLPRRWAASWSVGAMGLIGGLLYLRSGADSDQVPGIVTTILVSLGSSLALGLFITRMVGEGQRRAETIDELHRAQDRLAAAERDRGVHEERERMAREIHDTLAQGYTCVLALSRAADAALARGDVKTARERLGLITTTASDNLSQARLIVAETGPGHLESRTLVEALSRIVAAVGTESELDARLDVVGTPTSLGATADVVLLRTAQESLANVRKHARASRVLVTIGYAAGSPTTLEVSDDGIGFVNGIAGHGFGLDGIRARVAEIGGDLSVTSAPGEGTTVVVQVPS